MDESGINPLKQKPSTHEKDGLVAFVTEIARYFMEFLETDFHKVRSPKRKIQNRNSDNLQTGISLNKYKKYNSLVWKVIKSGFLDESICHLKKGVYTNQIPQTLINLIEEQISAIDNIEITQTVKHFQNEIELAVYKNQKDSTAAIATALDGVSRIIREKFLFKFIDKIREPLERIKITTIDSVYQIEEELTGILMRPLEEVIASIVNNLSLSKSVDFEKHLGQAFEFIEVKNKLDGFFKGFSVGDLFLEVSELFNNKNLLDKQEFYLYFGDIKYENHTYPIFYIPIYISKTADGFSLVFDSLLYVNKKAIQFVSQDYNANAERKGTLQSFIERIVYLSESEKRQHLFGDVDLALKEVITYFGLSPYIDINNPERQSAKGPELQLTNSCYISIFDKSDESLVNDYEDILIKLKEGNDGLATAFQFLIDDFLMHNPISCNSEVECDWGNQPPSDKLVYSSPIPLNEEQRQIIIALNKSNCKYLTVEGPPGTGKSHTITAIVCDAVLKNQSVLVLSDKKEALDVVEDKVTYTMNNVRLNHEFQNPILRLGQSGNSYSKILSTISINRIKSHHNAVKNEKHNLGNEITTSVESLKNQIKNNINAYNKINLNDVAEFTILDSKLSGANDIPIDLNECSDYNINSLKKNMLELKDRLFNHKMKLDGLFKSCYRADQRVISFQNFLSLLDIACQLRIKQGNEIENLRLINSISAEGLNALKKYIDECVCLKSEWFGYLFKGRKIKQLNSNLSSNVTHDLEKPHDHISRLRTIMSVFGQAQQLKETKEMSSSFEFKADFIRYMHKLLTLNINLPTLDTIRELNINITEIESFFDKHPATAKMIGYNQESIFSLVDNKLINYPDSKFEELKLYLRLKHDLHHYFNALPELNYSADQKAIEDLTTTQMTDIMDRRVLNFVENYRNDAKSLSAIISKKQRFDKSSFQKLKNAFPCILAGIRDFSEYIPLESDIFDIIIIDEASQVSIAQAFPALLRGKKIIVLGDKRQFSNVKSAQARSETNTEFLNCLRKVFIENISDETSKLNRLEKFNIKTSILEFFEHITNYNIMLRKHFRGYRETISYSNKYFYENTLQAIKIRGIPIEDVIRFSELEHDEKIDLIDNTNHIEINAIIAEVERLAKEEPKLSIGIITPHTNQQKILVEKFSKHPENESFQNIQKLKIMTFDTCQGEERDVIIYSMVANSISDKLWAIFIKDRNSVDLEDGGKIKMQRLNVGFSRAKERMHFFLSKPIDDFTGSIGEALCHYRKILDDSRDLPNDNSTDPRSPMESKVLHWIQETLFFKSNSTKIELHTQFPLGEYIKQIDNGYKHPAYVVDFLLIYNDEDNKRHNIIIEYDGFESHFINHESVNKFNYGQYYTEQHVYREKTLEGYGYNFLRINRFNLGKDPVETINERFLSLVKKKTNNTTF